MRILFLALLSFFISAPAHSQKTVSGSENVLEVHSPDFVHGIGFARLSTYNPSRSFRIARENAFTDLEASLLTSVYLEYYGTENTQSRSLKEYGISDKLADDEVVTYDSTIVGEWAVYFIKEPNSTTSAPSSVIHSATKQEWTNELFEPRLVSGYWVASGMYEQTRFNPNRGWTKAKQNALKNLSEYLNTHVQSLERVYDNKLSSVHYVTSKHIFQNIGVIGRKMLDGNYHLLLIVPEDDIIRIDG